MVRNYIVSLYNVDQTLARILDDISILIGEDVLSRFVVMYGGSEFKLPEVNELLGTKVLYCGEI